MNKTILLNNILNNIKEEHKELVVKELNRIKNDFNNLSDEDKEIVYSTHGTISYVLDDLSELDCEVTNVPLQFEDEVFLDSVDEDTKFDVYDMIIDYCTCEEDCD